MVWLLCGYMWLFIHRPFEVWESLGALRIEMLYMVATILCWIFAARKSWTHNPLHIAFGGFALALLTAWAASPHREMGSETVQKWFEVAGFYLLLITTLRDEKDLKRIVTAYVIAVGLYMAHSLWEYRNGRHQYTMGTARLLGIDITHGDPNTFAATILYSLPLAMALWPYLERMWQRGLLVGYGLLSATCVLLTSSRSGFVGLCFLGGMTAMSSRYRLRWLVLMVVMAPLAWQSLPQDRQNRFLTLIDPKYGPANAQESAEGRAKGWNDGVEIWSQHPVTGVGPGAFKLASGSGYESHQLYGQVLGELGTLGAIAFVGLVATFFANARSAIRLGREYPGLSQDFAMSVVRATTQTIVLLLLLGFSGHNLYRYTWLWFGAFQSIAMYVLNRRAEELAEADQNGENAIDEQPTLEALLA